MEDVNRTERMWTGLYLSLPLIKLRKCVGEWGAQWRETKASVKGDDALQPFGFSLLHGVAFLRPGNMQ